MPRGLAITASRKSLHGSGTEGNPVSDPVSDKELVRRTAEGLESLVLKPEYRSDVDNLVQDFYVPCFRESQSSSRAGEQGEAFERGCTARENAVELVLLRRIEAIRTQ